jgi:hypothetical protein
MVFIPSSSHLETSGCIEFSLELLLEFLYIWELINFTKSIINSDKA